MNVFKRKLKVNYKPHPLIIKLSDRLLAFQGNAAHCLNRRTRQFTRQQQLGLLAGICLVLGGGSLYLLLKAIL
ncbi:hypothetical protein [Mucilaginibacter sp.]